MWYNTVSFKVEVQTVGTRIKVMIHFVLKMCLQFAWRSFDDSTECRVHSAEDIKWVGLMSADQEKP